MNDSHETEFEVRLRAELHTGAGRLRVPPPRPLPTDAPRRLWRPLLAAAAVTAAIGAIAFTLSNDRTEVRTVDSPATTPNDLDGRLADSFALPYGLEQVAGTEPLGRPLAFHSLTGEIPPDDYNKAAEFSFDTDLWAVYRVTASNPVAVFDEWVDQLASTLDVGPGFDARFHCQPNPQLLEAEWCTGGTTGGGAPDWVQLTLWATDDEPILVVSVDRRGATTSSPPGSERTWASAPEPDQELPWNVAESGEVLLEEQSRVLTVPEGSRAVSPIVPLPGSPGSTRVFRAEDGSAAVRQLLDEALEWEAAEYREPLRFDGADGTTIHATAFWEVAGGPSFFVAAVRGPDDPFATVYVEARAG